MHNALCIIMHYALCIMHYALQILQYADDQVFVCLFSTIGPMA